MIITTTELNKILNEQNLVLIDTRSFKDYSEGHIIGAINLDLFAFHWFDTSKKGIENFNYQTTDLFSFVGITSEKKVVFYDDVSGILAARGVWMLQYFSHPNAFMLDGGFQKWTNENLPTETKTNLFKQEKFSGKTNNEILVGYEYIKDNLDRIKLVDARTKEEFNGTVVRAAQKGHIPGAINVDWEKNIKPNGTFKEENELEKLYPFSKEDEIVTYCQGAYRAANTFVALKKLGFKNVRVYLGSWGEWGNRLDLPVV
ncbi:MAG TPA: sulfurtransferase [Nitrosopumilaceae archaeon]|nr:sulfurtransferase [Nitrosopumilaceae archaeon]